jgi:calcium binding protein 39
VAKSLLEAPNFWLFFFTDLVQLKSFEVTADAFELLKVLLMGHGVLAAKFIQNNYAAFVCHFNLLLQSNNYVTCRESIRLLGELLLQRENFSIMMNYISDRENLKILMNLLRCKRKRIQIEAFHLFKVFVANPRKPVDITLILVKNRDKLVTYLRNFHNDKDADAQFAEEKALVVETLLGLDAIER